MAQMLNNDNFNSSVETGVCVVDFFATWCGPCKMLSLVLDQIKDVKIVKVDVDESPNLCKQYAIMSVPTLMIFKNGKMISKKNGYIPLEMINSWIEENR